MADTLTPLATIKPSRGEPVRAVLHEGQIWFVWVDVRLSWIAFGAKSEPYLESVAGEIGIEDVDVLHKRAGDMGNLKGRIDPKVKMIAAVALPAFGKLCMIDDAWAAELLQLATKELALVQKPVMETMTVDMLRAWMEGYDRKHKYLSGQFSAMVAGCQKLEERVAKLERPANQSGNDPAIDAAKVKSMRRQVGALYGQLKEAEKNDG